MLQAVTASRYHCQRANVLQNPCKTLGLKKNMVCKIPPGGGGGKSYTASGLDV